MLKHLLRSLLALILLGSALTESRAQCTNTVLDWDYRDFFARDNSDIRTYVSLAQAQTQYYMFGANKLVVTHNYTGDNDIKGDNTSHTGESGSFGSGADVQFVGDGVVTFTFEQPVSNLQFSLYDVDRNQRATFNANNGGTPVNINLGVLSSHILTINNNNGTSPYVSADNDRVCTNDDRATVNVTIAGPLTSFTITITNTGTSSSSGCDREDGSWWLSDVSACSPGSFPDDYYQVSRPFTGMPSYVVAVVGNRFYYVDPVTGNARFIFEDPTNSNMNSVAYDPYNRLIYYTYSLSGTPSGVNPNEKALRRYDVDMDTFGVVVQDATTFGLPIMGQGVESGAAAFYDGHLYWGIEANSNENIESIIYRVELDANRVPVAFWQIYAQPVRTGSGSRYYDWADFSLTNGILYDFDGGTANSSTGANCDFYQMNLLTGAVQQYTPVLLPFGNNPRIYVPRQTAIDWENNVYNIGPYAVTGSTQGQITLYDGTNNHTGSAITITEYGVPLTGSWGDGGDAFRPYCDFGDAPISYEGADPVWGPAVHEQEPNLKLGSGFSKEWLKKGNTSYDDDDDGLPFVPIFSAGIGDYLAELNVFNNTGENATVCAWLDFDGNGTFEPGEGISLTVPSSPSMQLVWLDWPVTPTTLWTGDSTYLRIRIALQSSGMTVNDPTGYFYVGEVEDFRVLVDDFPLPVQLISFDASVKNNSQVELKWKTAQESNIAGYEVQRSRNGSDWEYVTFVPSNQSSTTNTYTAHDNQPYKGMSMYRLRIKDLGTHERFSNVRNVTIKENDVLVSVHPNPAKTSARVSIQADASGDAIVKVLGIAGNTLSSKKANLSAGNNNIDLSFDANWPAGTYVVRVIMGEVIVNKKLVITK